MKLNENAMEPEFAEAWNTLWRENSDGADNHVLSYIVRSEEAVRRGLDLRKMRGACADLGFMGVPLDYYLTEAAHEAEVSLPGLLEPLARQAGNLWVALARAVSLPLEEARLMARAMFAQSLVPAVAGVRFRRGQESSEVTSLFQPEATAEAYVVAVETVEQSYEAGQRKTLEAM
ncbi:MAG TPA: hypothetical protein VGE39_18535, partial [Prosthecobacter sp.]